MKEQKQKFLDTLSKIMINIIPTNFGGNNNLKMKPNQSEVGELYCDGFDRKFAVGFRDGSDYMYCITSIFII